MGLILDSSVAIAAERRGDTVQDFLQRVVDTTGDQEAALSAVGLVELFHGIHRADTAERRTRREAFVDALLLLLSILGEPTSPNLPANWTQSSRAGES